MEFHLFHFMGPGKIENLKKGVRFWNFMYFIFGALGKWKTCKRNSTLEFHLFDFLFRLFHFGSGGEAPRKEKRKKEFDL